MAGPVGRDTATPVSLLTTGIFANGSAGVVLSACLPGSPKLFSRTGIFTRVDVGAGAAERTTRRPETFEVDEAGAWVDALTGTVGADRNSGTARLGNPTAGIASWGNGSTREMDGEINALTIGAA